MPERVITAIGVRSGPSMEGIDVALVVTDGEASIFRRQSLTFPLGERLGRPQAATDLTEFCASAVKHFLETLAMARDAVALIGFRGPATESEPGEALARATGIDVVYDFANADLEGGGQGEPLEPVYHRALADAAGLVRPVAVVEIGDGANVTFIGEGGSLAVFSTGGDFDADAIVKLRQSLPARPLLWLLAGDESRRAALIEALSRLLPEPVHRAEDMGWSGECFEAETYAYLAVRSTRKLPLTFPGTTGVRVPVTGGRLARAPRR